MFAVKKYPIDIFKRIGLLLLLLNTSSTQIMPLAYAEKSDRTKPLIIDSTRLTVDDINKISVFEEKVSIQQGELHMNGDKAIIKETANSFHLSTLTGSPASFQQKQADQSGYIYGWADQIVYSEETEQATLKGHARIRKTNGDEVTGALIEIDGKTSVYRVTCTKDCMNNTNRQGQVRVTIIPKGNSTSGATTPTPPLRYDTKSPSQ